MSMIATGKKLYYDAKYWLRWGRLQARRAGVARRWGSRTLSHMPVVFSTVMPKAGSHLLVQVLCALPQLGPFLDASFPSVNRTLDNRKLPPEAILARLRRLRPGEVARGFIPSREPFLSILTRPQWATIFVYRDPRDLIVSHVFYVTDMREDHAMHRYYTEDLQTMDERIRATILGVPSLYWGSITDRYASYVGWLEQPGVLSLRFEDFILDRSATLGRILDYLGGYGFTPRVSRQQAIETLAQAIQPARSPTFRKGQPGNWRQHFSDANKELMKDTAGDLLVNLGYERDLSW